MEGLECKYSGKMSVTDTIIGRWEIAVADKAYIRNGSGSLLAVDDRHVAFCEYNGSVARIICVAVATLANEKLLERASDNDLLLCRKSTSNKTCYRQ